MKFFKGMHVQINENIGNTERTFQCTEEMWEMRGKIFPIHTAYDESLYINGFTWHLDDVTEVCPEKEPQPFLFNVEELEYEERT